MFFDILIFYYTLINILTFFFMLFDKRRAILDKYRISEATLFKLSFAGGFIGFMAGMYAFRHKIRKWKFYVVGIVSMLLHCVLAYSVYNYFA